MVDTRVGQKGIIMRNQQYFFRVMILCFLFFIICLLIAPMIGPTAINLSSAWKYRSNLSSSSDAAILFSARIPRILFAALTGAALSAAGVAFQALLRNPLATPYTLGVSSGAACGAVLGMVLGFDSVILGIPGMQITGFTGALITVWLVYLLGKRTGGSTHTLLLAGVTMSFFFAAFIMLMQYLADFTQTYRIIHWLMGGLDIVDYSSFYHALPGVFIAIIILWTRSSEYNLLSTGEVSARAKGVNIEQTYLVTYITASLAVASVVCIVGPIGFVGLIIPHTLRLIVGSDHRILLPASVFCGAGFLILCDTAARTMMAPAELPVGVLTALLGGPFFLYILMKRRT
ncbi:iron ABC transporter permease [bacterium]|nr:iron ABC transporter permease [bacterium]